MSNSPIYLDHNATTPVDDEVRQAWWRATQDAWGNPSSQSAVGKAAKHALEDARRAVAELIGAQADEIVFVSGGTEANNTALKGLCRPGDTLVTSSIEHPSITAPAAAIERDGVVVRRLPVDDTCRLITAVLDDNLRGARLVSVILAHNETGAVQPIADVSRAARRSGVWVHSDAAQAVGKISVDVNALDVDLLSIAGHKLHAPKGIGALYVRAKTPLRRLMDGAAQQQGRRAGTEPVALAVALGTAARLAKTRWLAQADAIRARRERLWRLLVDKLGDDLVRHAESVETLPGTLFISSRRAESGTLLASLDNMQASTGSACNDGSAGSSAVLTAMGIDDPALHTGTIRLSLGHATTDDDVDRAASLLVDAIRRQDGIETK